MSDKNLAEKKEYMTSNRLQEEAENDDEFTSVYKYQTHDGHKLTEREDKFIGYYIITGNPVEAADRAGYFKSEKNPQLRQSKLRVYAKKILGKAPVRREIDYRIQMMDARRVADGQEVMEYFTKVMRGEVKDQFGLDAPLSERTKAAQELAKRLLDNPINTGETQAPSINIRLVKGA